MAGARLLAAPVLGAVACLRVAAAEEHVGPARWGARGRALGVRMLGGRLLGVRMLGGVRACSVVRALGVRMLSGARSACAVAPAAAPRLSSQRGPLPAGCSPHSALSLLWGTLRGPQVPRVPPCLRDDSAGLSQGGVLRFSSRVW